MGSSGLTEPDRRRRPNVAEAPLSPLPPAPMSLPVVAPLQSVSSLSRGSYGSFSAPNCPRMVTRLMIPVLLSCASLLLLHMGWRTVNV